MTARNVLQWNPSLESLKTTPAWSKQRDGPWFRAHLHENWSKKVVMVRMKKKGWCAVRGLIVLHQQSVFHPKLWMGKEYCCCTRHEHIVLHSWPGRVFPLLSVFMASPVSKQGTFCEESE